MVPKPMQAATHPQKRRKSECKDQPMGPRKQALMNGMQKSMVENGLSNYNNRETIALCGENYPNIEIRTDRCNNGITVVSCQVDNYPLYSVFVTIPTFITDSRGLPHTLEHLIFCGSKQYPERGYLDRLATLCQSNGTNAYTCDDYTCYTFTTSSCVGLERLLPVFLDHIVNPLLEEDEIVQREVFHLDPSGVPHGVVYCEMQAREWSEADQLDLALRRNLIARNGDPSLEVYSWECGGITSLISRLRKKDIIDYHAQYYHPENVTVVLCGGRDLCVTSRMAILASVEQVARPEKSPYPSPIKDLSIRTEFMESQVLTFPANDESLGSVGFAWMGPLSGDLYTIHALHVLMRMLKDTSASPLYQHFVERADPVASDIDYEIKPLYRTLIMIVFSGVPTRQLMEEEEEGSDGKEEDEKYDSQEDHENQKDHKNHEHKRDRDGMRQGEIASKKMAQRCFLEEGLLQRELAQVLEEWAKDEEAVRDRLQVTLKSIQLKMQEQMEDDPHELIASYIMPEIVAAHWPSLTSTNTHQSFGMGFCTIPEHFKRLSEEPLSFWLDLLQKYLLEMPPVEVRMYPSKEMIDKIKRMEEEQLANLPSVNLSKSQEESANTSEITPFEIECPKAIQCVSGWKENQHEILVRSDTLTKRLTLAIQIPQSIPEELWPYLVLFQELIFQSDLMLTEEIRLMYNSPEFFCTDQISYQELIETLSTTFTTYEAAVGFDNGLFTVSYFDSHFLLTLVGRTELTVGQMQSLLLTILASTVFTTERVIEVLENIISQLKDSWRDPSTVLECRMEELLASAYKRQPHLIAPPLVQVQMGLSKQTDFLLDLYQLLASNPEEALLPLRKLQSSLLSAPMLVNIGQVVKEPLPKEREINNPRTTPIIPTPYQLPLHGALATVKSLALDGLIEIVPMADITSSYLSWVRAVDLLPLMPGEEGVPTDEAVDMFLSSSLLCQLLSYTEGPIYRQIRGAGLAYDSALTLATWTGLLCLYFSESADPVDGLHVLTSLLEQILNEAHRLLASPSQPGLIIFEEERLRAAKAAQIYHFVSERSTPASIIATSFRCTLRGLPAVGSPLEVQWNRRLLDLTLRDLARCAINLLEPLRDPNQCIRLLAVPSSKLSTIKADLQASGYTVRVADYVGEACEKFSGFSPHISS